MLTTKELRQLPTKDLQAELETLSRDLMKIKMNIEGTSDRHKAESLRKQIARVKTVQREVQLEEATKAPAEKEVKEEKDSK
ncbi:MAG: 50S ribosomal protein L29 [Candidatus Gracilibacteria bacterium]|nr:50S ribosomal protein L29 [Candidatus Peregrinibacteria bacterium]